MSTDTQTPTSDRASESGGRTTALHGMSRAVRRAAFTVIISASGSIGERR